MRLLNRNKQDQTVNKAEYFYYQIILVACPPEQLNKYVNTLHFSVTWSIYNTPWNVA